METSSFLLVGLLILHMMPTALATIKCYECGNTPEHPNPSSCNREHVKNITCDNPFFDRCMTITGTLTVPGNGSFNFKTKNCTSSFICLVAVMGMCKLSNATAGMISNCKIDCCEGDLCNTDNTAVRISGFITSSVVGLLALLLNLFPRA